jgi:hypothetical protein
MRIPNSTARRYVQEREEFTGSNVEAYDTSSTTGTDLYIVQSYGDHFPMFVAEEHDGVVRWYGNADTWGPTTSKHQQQCRQYDVKHTWFGTDDMITIARHGITGLMAGRVARK